MNNHKRECDGKCEVTRWVREDGRIVYSTELVEGASRCGWWQRCTNTIEDAPDLCDFSDPNQYLQMQSHNQPHK